MTTGRRPYEAIKRAFDLIVATTVLILAAPLWAGVAIAIRLNSPGPILYRGARVGRHGVEFQMLKFRSMVVRADRAGIWSTAEDDPRITRVGRKLRRYKLDELPNLVNVLRGEMSLVGPRAQVPADVAKYTAEERQLLSIRPGITDYASLHFRNEGEILRGYQDPDLAYDRLIRPEKSRLGLEYVRTRSLWVDIKILTDTVRAMLDLPGAPPAAEIPPKESS